MAALRFDFHGVKVQIASDDGEILPPCRSVRSTSLIFREQGDEAAAACWKKCVKTPVAATSDCCKMSFVVDPGFRGVAADGPKLT